MSAIETVTCGCCVLVDSGGQVYGIKYCDQHAAAILAYKALQSVRSLLVNQQGLTTTDKAQKALEQVDDALAMAEGRWLEHKGVKG